MAGFIRRFQFFPAVEILTAIEGTVIIDTPPAGDIQGVNTGVACLVGEFANMSYCCDCNSSGEVISSLHPVEVYSQQDLVDKVGPFDELIGKFGSDCGNGWVELRNKKFSRLVIMPVDFLRPGTGTTYGIRLWRDLPTHTSATDLTPITPVVSAKVQAGREFYNGANKCRIAEDVVFTDTAYRTRGVDGTTAVAAGTTTTTIDSATAAFVANGVKEGDIVVAGSLNAGAGTQNLLCAATLRVVQVNSATQITVEHLNGTSTFTDGVDWENGAALAFTVYPSTNADTGGEHQMAEDGGYTVLARSIGAASIARRTVLTPSVVPTAGSGSSWNSLSGLGGKTHYTGDGANAVIYDATLHVANAANDANHRTRYNAAIDALMSDDLPASAVNLVWAARKYSYIAAKLELHAQACSERGLSRIVCISPELDEVTQGTILNSSSWPGVATYRDERVIFCWPGVQTTVDEAVGYTLTQADGTTDDEGIMDVTSDGWLVSLLSNLQPELNPGQAAPPVPSILAPVLGLQRGVSGKSITDYILYKQYGICAPRMDRTVGPIFQSGVTSSLTSGEKNINRRRMADYIQDSLAQRTVQYAKVLNTSAKRSAVRAEIIAFLDELKSENNPMAQRIEDYQLDDVSGNTPDMTAAGVYVIILRVRMLGTMDTIVLQTEIGPSVTISTV